MSGHPEPPSLLHRFVMTCLGFLLGAWAIYAGVRLIEAIWVWVVGIGGVVLLLWVAIMVYKAKQDHW